MAHRPSPEELDHPLTAKQLKQLNHSLSLLSESSLLKEYERAHEACRLKTDVLPKAANVQSMVAAWKTAVEVAKEPTATSVEGLKTLGSELT